MKALVLEDVARFEVRERPAPAIGDRDVLIRIGAVGICGTDLHIFNGHANLNLGRDGRKIPLTQSPQVLGHEFGGVVEAVGKDVKKFKPGDRVIADQHLSCRTKGLTPMCEYCETDDSLLCVFGDQLGISGLPGALAEFISIPECNVLMLPASVSFTRGAIIEPFACVLRACNRMERSPNRYTFEGRYRIRNVLITGAGPSGLLFLQYLRNVRKFDGQVFVVDLLASKLALATKLGGTPLDVRAGNLDSEIRKRTHGELIHLIIEASGAGPVFDLIPLVMRNQATFIYYGSGHSGRDVGVMSPFQFMEANMVTSGGAAGGFDPDGTPEVYRRSMEYVRDGLIDAESLLSHRYTQLSELQKAFAVDSLCDDFIKGAWVQDSVL